MALYLATDDRVQGPVWSDASPQFNVQPLHEDEEAVRAQFSKQHVVHLGAHTGCSCGFSYGFVPLETPEDVAEDRNAREAVAALRQFLEQCLANSGTLELFACWEGDQGTAPDSRVEVSTQHFSGDSFQLAEKQFYLVRRAG